MSPLAPRVAGALLALAAAATVLGNAHGPARVAAAGVLFALPGFAVVDALVLAQRGNRPLAGAQRVGYAVATSLASVLLAGLVLIQFPRGFTATSVVAILLVETLAALTFSSLRVRSEARTATSLPPRAPRARMPAMGPSLAALALVAAGWAAGLSGVRPPDGPSTLLAVEGDVASERMIFADHEATIDVFAASGFSTETSWLLSLVSEKGTRLGSENGTIWQVGERATLASTQLVLDGRERASVEVPYRIAEPGEYRILIRLYGTGPSGSGATGVLREVYVWVEVADRSQAHGPLDSMRGGP